MRVRPKLLLHAAPLLVVLLGGGCASAPIAAEPPPTAEPAGARADVTPHSRAEFTLEADKLDTWNAVGQILVRTPGVEYQGRSQMLDLYSLRYRGIEFLILTKALLASETNNRLTTRVAAITATGKPLENDSKAVTELLMLLQRELPMEIQSVRARQASGRQASVP